MNQILNNLTNKINGFKPLPGNVRIDNSPLHGKGLFAKKAIPKDHDFGITHVADSRFPDGLIRTPFGGFINHSYSPNCELYEDEDTFHARTVKDVVKDEELTVDYYPYYTKEELAEFK